MQSDPLSRLNQPFHDSEGPDAYIDELLDLKEYSPEQMVFVLEAMRLLCDSLDLEDRVPKFYSFLLGHLPLRSLHFSRALPLYLFVIYRVLTRKTFYSKSFNISLAGITLITTAVIVRSSAKAVTSRSTMKSSPRPYASACSRKACPQAYTLPIKKTLSLHTFRLSSLPFSPCACSRRT